MSLFLEVSIGDSKAGILSTADGYRSEFQLDPAYSDDPNRPVLGQLFEDEPRKIHRGKNGAAPRWFGNLLPESGSRLRRYLGRAGGIEPRDDLGFLELLGLDLPGAVRIEKATEPAGVDSTPLVAADPREEPIAAPPPGLRISLAGIQLKFSVVADGERITLPAKSGEGTFILKVAGQEWEGLAGNEAAMMRWAALAGFEVAEARVVPFPDLGLPTEILANAQESALLVRRFDRQDGRRIHQEDLAQVTGIAAEDKYSGSKFHKLAPLIRNLLGDSGLEEYLRRLALMVVQGNADAHLKNWSLRYADGRTAAWSPLYDQVSTIAWPEVSSDLALELAGIQHLRGVTLDAFAQVAKTAGYSESRARELVIATIDRLRAAWSEVLELQPLHSSHRLALVEHWRRCLLLRNLEPLEP